MTGAREAGVTAAAAIQLGDVTRDGDRFHASMMFPGLPEHVRTARRFADRVLGHGHPCEELARLLTSELVTNSVMHSRSRGPEGTVGVTVSGTPDSVLVEVADAGAGTVPQVRAGEDPDDEGGRGLRLVAEMADEWGCRQNGAGCVTWFSVKAGS